MNQKEELHIGTSSVPPSSFRLSPSDTWVRLLLAPVVVFIACGIDRNYQTDLWHHLARGRVIVTEGRLLDEDRFAFTDTSKPFQDVNWLSQVAFYALHQAGGLELLQVVNALVLAGTMAILVLLCQRRSGSMLVAGGVGLFIFFGLWQLFLIRPQTLSLLLFVLLYAVLEGTERRPWLLALAPCLLAMWVNLHGAFPIGLVLIGCYLLAAFLEGVGKRRGGVWRDQRVGLLASCLAAAALATLVNPYGWRVYQYVGLTSGTAQARKIDEWLPPGLDLLSGKVWVASVLALLVLFALPGRRPTVREVCLVLCFLPPACGSVRMVAWWLLIAAPIAASLLAANLPRERLASESEGTPTLGAGLTCAALLVAVLLSLPWLERGSPYFRLGRSVHRTEDDLQTIADRLQHERRTGRVFTRFEWSEYLTWSLGPDFSVFMDGRIEIFPDEVWSEYSAVTSGRADWQEILDKYKVDYLLIDAGPYHASLRPFVEGSKLWQRIDEAGDLTLYRRTASHSGASQPLPRVRQQ
jgi:hypothetical protein